MKLVTLIYMLVLFSSASSFAGPGVNNGGGGWSCKLDHADGFVWIKTTELAPSNYYAQAIATFEQSGFRDIFNAKLALLRSSSVELSALIDSDQIDIFKSIHFIDREIEFIDDGQIEDKPPGSSCSGGTIQFVQIADYLLDEALVINTNIWNSKSFSEADKAGLLLHELIYKVLRDKKNVISSYATQTIVRALFRPSSNDLSQIIHQAIEGIDPNRKAKIITFGFKLFCYGAIDDGSHSQTPPIFQMNTLEPGDHQQVDLGGFRFVVDSNSNDGRPALLSITDLDSGVKSTLDDRLIFAAFRENKTVSFTLEKPAKHVTASFTCEAE